MGLLNFYFCLFYIILCVSLLILPTPSLIDFLSVFFSSSPYQFFIATNLFLSFKKKKKRLIIWTLLKKQKNKRALFDLIIVKAIPWIESDRASL